MVFRLSIVLYIILNKTIITMMEKTLITSKSEAESLYDTLIIGNYKHIHNESKEAIMNDVSEFFNHKTDISETLVITQNDNLKTFTVTVTSLKS